LAGLSLDEKKRLLAEMLKKSGQSAPRIFPLASGQKALWILHQQEPESAAYNTPFALRIRSEADVDALRRSFEMLASRHPSFRTTFAATPDGQLLQTVHPTLAPGFSVHDAKGWSPDALHEAIVRAYRAPFSLEKGPLLRGDLYKISEDDLVLLITVHHIVYDGWSAQILQRELSQSYLALSKGGQATFAPITGAYSDFVTRQGQLLASPRGRAQWDYWQKKLSGELPFLALPADRARTALSGNRSGACPLKLDLDLTSKVKSLAQSEQVTPFVVLLTAYAALLSRLARQDDVVIGSPTTGRSSADSHDVIGYFANPVALRANLSGNPSTKAVIGRMRQIVHEALAHQEFPLASIVERLEVERRPGVSPIFQASMTFQSSREGGGAMDLWATPEEDARIRWGHVELEPYPIRDIEGQFDLTLEMWEARGALAGALRYNRDLFDDATVRLWRGYFEALLGEMVQRPEAPIASLSLGEIQTARTAEAVVSRAPTITSWFEGQVAKTPSAIALTFGDQNLSYAELNHRANVLAHELQGLGVGPETLVGICVDRTPELVIAILGVLKAGGAYVPLDPASPKDRIALILEDAEVKALVTETKRKGELASGKMPTIFVDGIRWDDPCGKASPRPQLTPDNAAYVIYTSGSTGRPKGVIVTHANCTRLFTTTEPLYGFDAKDVWTLFHSAAFDFSVWELWGPLFYGGRLVVVPHWMTRSPEAFAELLHREGVTVLNQTPSAFRALMRAPSIADGKGGRAIRYVIFGGEALDAATIRPWLEKYPVASGGGQLVNMYGITETTVHVTFHRVTEADLVSSASPIGRPIPDLEMRLLDEHQNPVPVGVPGEIFVGGPGVARGYLKRPELTAQRFIDDPKNPGKKLYRSGDLAIRRVDGTFDYLGRIDDQVKIRGFRIELGEIQSLIAEHSAVAEAHITTYERSQDDKRIVAYVVPKEGASELVLSTPAHVGEWTELYDELYARSATEEKTDWNFNIAGWNSSYSSNALSSEAMKEWVERTVEQILAQKPASVFEIGCGTGLMLTRIAPSTTAYWGTDISKVVVEKVGEHAKALGLRQVKLFHKAADQLGEIDFGTQTFDAVIINSVVQYFPSAEYLARALITAAKHLNKGGFIFVGDVRNHRLLEAFHASIALAQHTGAIEPKAFKEKIARRMAGEEELVLHPDFFWGLRARIPGISHVEVRPKRGVCLNELTRFRCDVLLHIDSEPFADPELSWGPGDLTLPEIRTRLSRTNAPHIGLRGIRNARLQPAVESTALIHGESLASTSVEKLKKRMLDRDGSTPVPDPEPGIDPEALHQLAEALSLDVALDWSRGGADGSFDAVFLPKGSSAGRPISFGAHPGDMRPTRIANDPLRGRLERRLETELRKKAQERLPEYMVPASIMVIDKLPLTENGKVDRRALPFPVAPNQLDVAYVDPRTGEEEILASIFSELLGAERVGVHDSFFALGGHSLLATQVVSRIRTVFGVDLPLRALFDGPTVAQLAAAVSALRAAGGTRGPSLELAKAEVRPDEIPLSPAQERMWILDRVEETRAPIYIIPLLLRLRGPLDRSALEKSISLIVQRHEVLRTSLPMRGERAVQAISEESAAELGPSEDLSRAHGASEAELLRILQEQAGLEVSRPFDLARGPLLRTRLFRIADNDHLLVVTLHHIISDGWSMGVLARELGAAYNAFRADGTAGSDPALPELPIQYADVAIWQRRIIEEGTLAPAIEASKKRLLGAPPFLDLPTDRVRAPAPSFKGGVVRFAIDRSLTARLKDLSRREGVTLYMTLLAAYGAYLSRISNQKDMILGSPVANRNRALTEPLIGLFVNTLALRIDLTSDPSFLELLAKVRQTTLDAYADQDVPFEKLVEAISPERSLNRQPLVQAMFVLQNAPFSPPELEGLAVEVLDLDSITAKFDLTLSMQETQDGLSALFEYSAELFDRARIERMAEHFNRLLGAIVDKPKTRVPELAFMSEAEARQIESWSIGPQAVSTGTLLEQFLAHAARDPNAIALEHRTETMSYGELDKRSSRLAHRLVELGVGPEKLVALCLPQGFDRFVSLLAVWKARGAYVPLDPDYPPARIEHMLRDSNPELLVTVRALAAELKYPGKTVVLEDPLPEETSPLPLPAPRSAAYVIYTSGSTGKPKGCVLEHRGVPNVVVSSRDVFEIKPSSAIMQFASLSFDASVWEYGMAFGTGARLVLPPDESARVAGGLADALEKHKVTHLSCPNSVIASLPDGKYPHLESLIAGGEATSREQVTRWASASRRFYNAYGPTETTIIATAGRCAKDDTGSVSIGTPIHGAIIRILDADNRLVPAGVYGEICVGGVGVGRHYIGLDTLTKERFIQDPFSADGRLYKSGDVGRWKADGSIEIAGRRDHQVKLRGYRIELGEIETVLESYPGVKQSLAIVHQNQLVAYVAGVGFETRALREHAAARLPDYMVPSQFIVLEAFPLTPNAKIDRKKLPDPSALIERTAYVAPSTPAEEILAELFASILKRDKVGVHDNFFSLGGDSILGLQVIARATQRGLKLRPRQLFQHQTIAELAKVAIPEKAIDAEQGLVTGRAPLLPGQRRAQGAILIAIEVDQSVTQERAGTALAALEAHHDALRLRFRGATSVHPQAPAPGVDRSNRGATSAAYAATGIAPPAIELAPDAFQEVVEPTGSVFPVGERNLPDGANASSIYAELYAGIDPEHGPIMRAALVRTASTGARLLVVIHKLVLDASSARILADDLKAALTRDRPLPPKTTSFVSWSNRLAKYANTADVRAELDAWLAAADRDSSDELPLDDPSATDLEEDASTIAVFLDAEETRALFLEVPSAYDVTADEALIAALARTICGFNGQDRARIDLEGAGRETLFEDVDLLHTTGCFADEVPLQVRAAAREAPRETLTRVKDAVRRAPRGGLGFGLLRYLSSDPTIHKRLEAVRAAPAVFRLQRHPDPRIRSLRAPGAVRPHRLEIEAILQKDAAEERLRVNWTFGADVFRSETIERLGASFIGHVRDLIRARREPAAQVRVAADFPAAKLSSRDLAKVLAQTKKRR
jgi:amino acid adenylation domain-containing protein/non-ribosomal peptide synthase protein (TIGR01720 family)